MIHKHRYVGGEQGGGYVCLHSPYFSTQTESYTVQEFNGVNRYGQPVKARFFVLDTLSDHEAMQLINQYRLI